MPYLLEQVTACFTLIMGYMFIRLNGVCVRNMDIVPATISYISQERLVISSSMAGTPL